LSSASGAIIQFTDQGSKDWGFGIADGTSALTFFEDRNVSAAGTARMTIASGGNVGIGTSTAATTLSFPIGTNTVIGQTYTSSHAAGNVGSIGIGINDGGGAASGVYVHNTHNGTYSSQDIRFSTDEGGVSATTERMRITSAGNVGIGTTAPAVKLQIDQNQAALSYLLDTNNTTNGGSSIWRMITRNIANSGTTSVDFYKPTGSGFSLLNNDTHASNFTAFGIGGTERMRIDSSGNVGIGTAAPYSQLDVYSTITGPTLGEASGVGTIRITNGAAALTSAGGLEFKNAGDANGYGTKIQALNSGGSQLVFANRGGSATWTETMRIASSGNVGIGTTTPQGKLNVGSGRSYFGANSETYSIGVGYTQARVNSGQVYYIGATDSATPSMVFSAATGTETMRIDSSGKVMVNQTATIPSEDGRLQVTGGAGTALGIKGGSNDYFAALYNTSSSLIGSITGSNGSTTSYNTTSDYRLKNTIAPMTGALAKVALLKPVTYKWNVDDSDGQGFIAHELKTVVPDCVSGEKDAVDAEGNPQYQGVDTSFLVATLTAAIQEQQALIEALTNRITALEG
jgi:hypothetical protein